MGKPVLEKSKIKKIIELRKQGFSFPEIKRKVGCGYSTVARYAADVKVTGKYLQILKAKQKQSLYKSQKEWKLARSQAEKLLKNITTREKLFMLLALYWGEGTKAELNIMNGDPNLLRVFLCCLREIGIKDNELVFGLRIFSNSKSEDCLKYWSKGLNMPKARLKVGEVINGSDSKRLPFGMCRVRVIKGAKYFKLIMSMIEYVSQKL